MVRTFSRFAKLYREPSNAREEKRGVFSGESAPWRKMPKGVKPRSE